jgi:prophage regulatory protein
MPRLTGPRAGQQLPTNAPGDASNIEADHRPADRCHSSLMPPLLLAISDLAVALSRSPASLHRDDAAGRLPAPLRIGGSKRWRHADIALWVELGCPPRAEFEEIRKACHDGADSNRRGG